MYVLTHSDLYHFSNMEADWCGSRETVQKAYDTSLETIGHVSQIVEQLFQRTRTAVI